MARALKGDDMGRRIEAKDQRCQERQELQDIIPLAAPFVFYIDPTNACNFKCIRRIDNTRCINQLLATTKSSFGNAQLMFIHITYHRIGLCYLS